MKTRHQEWIDLGVPKTLVSAYELCYTNSEEHQDDHDQAAQIMIELIAEHIVEAR